MSLLQWACIVLASDIDPDGEPIPVQLQDIIAVQNFKSVLILGHTQPHLLPWRDFDNRRFKKNKSWPGTQQASY